MVRVPRRPASRRPASRALALCAVLGLLGALMVAMVDERPAEAGWSRGDRVWESETCGETERITVPAGVTKARILARGGGGGAGGNQFTGTGGAAGIGGVVQQTYPVTAGTDISVVVGCLGASGSAAANDTATPGWSTGGGAGIGSTSVFEGGASGGAGGGATGVCIGSSTCAPGAATLRLVGGGGGGGGVTNCSVVDAANSRGGRGGITGASSTSHGGGIGLSGQDGASSNGAGGAGGVNSTPGAATGGASANGSGGLGVNVVGGGGGGGYRGGQAGSGASTGCVGGGGGGGGSSWAHGTEVGYTGGSCAACVPERGEVEIALLRPVTTELTSSANPSGVGETVGFTAKVYDDLGPHTYTQVEFYRDGVLMGSDQTDLSGVASLSRSFSTAGSYTIEARPQTSFSDGPTSDSLVQRVEDGAPAPVATATAVSSSLNPSSVGDEVTFTASVTAGGSAVTDGTVAFAEGSTVLAAAVALDSSGDATFTTSSLAAGSHTITATYGGTAGHMSSTDDVVQFVEAGDPPAPAATATQLTTSTPSPTTYGQTAAFAAAVTSEGSPVTTGSVEILVDGTVVDTLPVDTGGSVAWESDRLAPGSHTVQAHYLGTADLAAGASSVLDHRVDKAPTHVTLTSSASSSAPGQEVTFTVVVDPVSGASFEHLPEGTVQIYDGTTLLGDARVAEVVTWTFATSSLSEGDREITARYLGDERFLPSEASIRHHVGEAPATPDEPGDGDDSGDGDGSSTVDPGGSGKPGADSSTTSDADQAPVGSSRLPRTGAGVAGLVAGGLAAIAVGAALLTLRRRRAASGAG